MNFITFTIVSAIYLLTTLTTTTFAQSSEVTIKCPASAGIVYAKHPNSCSKYFLCIHGKPIEQECADDLYFNIDTGYCGPQSAVKCNLDLCANKDIIELVANPEDCSRYFLCNHGVQVPLECGADRLFDPIKNHCNDAQLVVCKEPELLAPVIPNVCPLKGISQIPHPTDCSRFIVCMEGMANEYKCSDGLNFDMNISRCNYPRLSKCFK